MKKFGLFAFLLTISSLTGCGYKVPSTPQEKVRTAFKGVERSFKTPKLEAKRAALLEQNTLKAIDIPTGLEKLSRLYTNDDRDNDSLRILLIINLQ